MVQTEIRYKCGISSSDYNRLMMNAF